MRLAAVILTYVPSTSATARSKVDSTVRKSGLDSQPWKAAPLYWRRQATLAADGGREVRHSGGERGLGGCGKEAALQDTQQRGMEVRIAWVGFWLIWVVGGSTRGLLSGAMDILGIATGVDEMIKSTKVDEDKVPSAPQSSRMQVESTHFPQGVGREGMNGVC